MTSHLASSNSAHFTSSTAARTANRERPVTPGRTTLYLAVLVAVLGGACGGGSKPKESNTYVRASSVQQECCEHAGGNRDSCLKDIVRVEDFAQQSPQNQATYACVANNFTCDPASGHATQPSAQAQLDCIQDLH